MSTQPSMFPGALIGPYVQPPDNIVAFRCACGDSLGYLHLRHWTVYWHHRSCPSMIWAFHFCPRCGMSYSPPGDDWDWDVELVYWVEQARLEEEYADERGRARFMGLKEWEDKEHMDAEFEADRGHSSYYSPTNPAFLEGGC